MAPHDVLVHGRRLNAAIGWVLTGVIALVAIESFLTNALLLGVFALVMVAVLGAPAAASGDWTVMVPWPLVLTAALAMVVWALGRYPEIAGYVAVTALALVAVAELDALTSIDMSRRFTIVFAVLTTMAIQSVWTVAQYASDRWLGTEFLRSLTELQWDFVIVAVVAILGGVLFGWFTARFGYPKPSETRGSETA